MQHEQQPHEGGTDQQDTSAEHETGLHPRIYVVDLNSAERGIEHGLWIDAKQAPDDIEADIAAMLDSSPTVDATDWAVGDSEDFAGLDLSAITDTTLISRLARGVAAHGHPFAAWSTLIAPDHEQLDRFEAAYVGSYASPEAWARVLAGHLGWHDALDRAITDPLLRPYVVLNYAAIVQDSFQHWHFATGADGRTHVFVK